MKTIAVDADIIEKAKRLRRELHRNAELSGCETNTKRIIIDFISKNTSLEAHDMGAWCYFVYRAKGENKRRIAFRADMDALPVDEGDALAYCSLRRGVSHKCGHDGHSACLAAFALFTDRHGAKNDIIFLFQHAEETGEGGPVCQRLIALEKVDEIYAFHNMPGFPLCSVAVHSGTAACASRGIIIKLKGKNSHASQPENGRNPAYALAELIAMIPAVVDEAADAKRLDGAPGPVPGFAMSPTGMVMCTVVGAECGSREDGGGTDAFGTSAGFARLMLTLRAEDESRLDRLEAEMLRRAAALAERQGLGIEKELRDPFPETRNDPACAEKVRAAARALGLQIAEWNEPFRSSEDFGCYLKLTPGALFYIGSGEEHAPLHTASYDFPDDLTATAVKMFAALS